jgi:hypothetical protein
MFLGSKVRPVRKVDNLTAICEPTVGSLTCHNLTVFNGLVQGIALLIYIYIAESVL